MNGWSPCPSHWAGLLNCHTKQNGGAPKLLRVLVAVTVRPAEWGQGSDERYALSNLSVLPDLLMRMPACIPAPPPPKTHLLPLQRSLGGQQVIT